MNENEKSNKKVYVALLVCTILAIVAIIVTSIVVGVTGNGAPTNDARNATHIDTPADEKSSDEQTSDNTPSDERSDKGNEDEDDTPTSSDEPVAVLPQYVSPLTSYTVGAECKTDELVWSNTLHWYATHNGTDFCAESGAVVRSVYDGNVTDVRYTTQDGYVVTILQSDGVTVEYKSLGNNVLVEKGDKVSAGTYIGYVSDSMASEQNDGAHLHLEMKTADGEYIDPMTKLPSNEK